MLRGRDRLVQNDYARVVQEGLVRVELRMRVRCGAVPLAGRVERGGPVVVALRVLAAAVRRAWRQDREVRCVVEVDPHVIAASTVAAAGGRGRAVLTDRVRAVTRGEHDGV